MSDKHIPAFQRIEGPPTKAELRIYAELQWLKEDYMARAKPLMDLLAEIEATKTPRYIIMPDALVGHGEGMNRSGVEITDMPLEIAARGPTTDLDRRIAMLAEVLECRSEDIALAAHGDPDATYLVRWQQLDAFLHKVRHALNLHDSSD